MLPASIWLVIGTRPEAIKLSPVAHALAARGHDPLLVFTGQHRGLDPSDFALERFAAINLGCDGLPDPDAHAQNVERALAAATRIPPELLVVQGDTSSAYGAARAGVAAGVAVAHVEAGLRTHDQRSPWPEEGYRTAIDAAAALLFAPTAGAAANLEAEGVRGSILVTGNSGIDATVTAMSRLPPRQLRERHKPMILVTCHRRESWGAGLAGIAAALHEIGASGLADVHIILHPNAHVGEAMRAMLGGRCGITLSEPCAHPELLMHMRDADLVLSDSGGIQEEAPAFGVPLLILRDKTERPEGIASGNAILVGTDAGRIGAEVRRLLGDPGALAAMSRCTFPYGDGNASARIAAAIDEYLDRRCAAISAIRR